MTAQRQQPNTCTLSQAQNILVIRYRFIGDTLLMVPFLRNLRRAFPQANIDVLVAPNSGEILAHCPYINNLIVFDTTRKHQYESGESENPRSFLSYALELRNRQYDTAFVLKRSFSSALLARLANIPRRIGYDTEWRGWLLTDTLPYHQNQHEVECFLDVLRAVEIPVADRYLECWSSGAEKAHADELVKDLPPGVHVLLHATASNEMKQWPQTFWIQLSRWLVGQQDTHIHFVGAPADYKHYRFIEESLPQGLKGFIHNWCGQTTLNESLALIEHFDFAVGVDSGTLHMAAAVGKPVIGLFTEKNVQKWAPLSHNTEEQQIIVLTEQSLMEVQAQCLRLIQQTHKQP